MAKKKETQVGDWWIDDDFIGIFETKYDTTKLIEFWEEQNAAGACFHRVGFPNANGPGDGRDRTDHLLNHHKIVSIEVTHSMQQFQADYNGVVAECLDLYLDRFTSISNLPLLQMKINVQRTQPMGGYHAWHCESNGPGHVRDRLLASMMYLNTIPPGEGGETEFLYQSKRICPVAGRVVIWPAGFTHTHRGNPPLSGDKYIATSWIEQQHPPISA